MSIKDHLKVIEKLSLILRKLNKKATTDFELLKLLREAMASVKVIAPDDLLKELESQTAEVESKIEEDQNGRREALLLSAREAGVACRRFGEYDRVCPFKVSYRGPKVRLELGSEVFQEFQEADGKQVFGIICRMKAELESESLDRALFFRTLKQSYRLAKDEGKARDGGWVPIRTLYGYFVILRHTWFNDFIKNPDAKKFRNYSSARFAYDLARFGREGWGQGDEILQTRTPSMATVASGETMTLPSLDTVEVTESPLATLRVDRREA